MWPIARPCRLGSEGISLGLALIAAIGLSMRCIFSTWFYSTKKGRSRMAALCIISSCLFSYRRSPWLLLVSLHFNYTKKPPRRFVTGLTTRWLFETLVVLLLYQKLQRSLVHCSRNLKSSVLPDLKFSYRALDGWFPCTIKFPTSLLVEAVGSHFHHTKKPPAG